MNRCPICGQQCDTRLLAFGTTLQPAVARLIATYHAAWRPQDGLCPSCAQQYTAKLVADRRDHTLHTATDPYTTFPFYHPWEEIVHSQSERLPDYQIFAGKGTTIAFLDSGYYPHPDLLKTTDWHGALPQWEQLHSQDFQRLLPMEALRFADYIDLTDGGERTGLTQPSLWDGAGDSWHGQMTSTLVAGNGLLSNGHYRGYAAGATILPIKIGRGGGRIPEADILRGLEWLLKDDRWAQYNVRVLNISVGGDYNQPWSENPVAQAAEALFERGVFIAAAAGNSGHEELRAPASAPSVLTVGGVDDGNHPWSFAHSETWMGLYPHNYGVVTSREKAPLLETQTAMPRPGARGRRMTGGQARHLLQKPELLALARWLPAPILPVSPIFREVATLGELRRLLLGYDPLRNDDFGWRTAGDVGNHIAQFQPPTWMPEVWHGLRRRMNAHKWIHPYYQHVDGTSVSVAQVSAVAAQMVQANPTLAPARIRELLLASAMPLPHLPHHLTGHGLLQPRKAVALALRASGGCLAGMPLSSTPLTPAQASQLQIPTWAVAGVNLVTRATSQLGSGIEQMIYFGCYAPDARQISLVGEFNEWRPGEYLLERTDVGWWHGALTLPQGRYAYRFWLEKEETPEGTWLPDYENPATIESGYTTAHSLLVVE